jgi:hypothetical protein
MHAIAKKEDSAKESLFESLLFACMDPEYMTLNGAGNYRDFDLVHHA